MSRRDFLRLMGASLALAGLSACTRQPDEKIVPYVRRPEEIVPGKPLFYATAFTLAGFAEGILVESHEGRPTKIEGNPDHPASLGATDPFAQASVLELYDPDRSQVVLNAGRVSTWDGYLAAAGAVIERQRRKGGSGLRVLTETVSSPTLAHQLEALLEKFPRAKWHQYEPAVRDNAREGARLAFGEDVHAVHRFDRAEVVLSLENDFLFCTPANLRYARDFMDKRRLGPTRKEMNRLYVVESIPSITGAMADHRLPLQSSAIEAFARAVAFELGVKGAGPGGPPLDPRASAWASAVAGDLRSKHGASLVLSGDTQPPHVHALAHAMNQALGNVGKTVIYTPSVEARPVVQIESLRELVEEMRSGAVEALIIIGGNPAFNAPPEFLFSERLLQVPFRVHLSLYQDETSALCHWHIPNAHYLETWSDSRAFDGTATILQPLIAPLYNGKSAHELIATLTGESGRSSHDIVRDYWRKRFPAGDFETQWRTALHDGLVAGTAFAEKRVSLKHGFYTGSAAARSAPPPLEIVFRPDPTIWDGRFANNAWLQELPKPLTKITWDNAAHVSPATAARLGLKTDDVVELRHRGSSVRAPVWIMPGHADESVSVHFGYGRRRAGGVGTGAGFNAYALRSAETPWFGRGLEILKTGSRQSLASTQRHQQMEGRHLVRVGTLEQYRLDPEFAQEMGHEPDARTTLYPQWENEGYAWGMVIDLNACTGCSACVVACQAENNIPTVGREQVLREREMHWIRVDVYHHGSAENPEFYHQPVPCMHCENAPCEPVCPVAATVHSSEGLNEMVYNRCVGTRYCSNNCPYKVRRFNFLQYADYDTPSLKLLHNPDVTVRSRGVMEKCTYCVQRINAARIEAKKEGREIKDGDIQTACQQACPTGAIVFGNIGDPKARVTGLKSDPRNYTLLAELNTRPRTSYLARIRNPNPKMA